MKNLISAFALILAPLALTATLVGCPDPDPPNEVCNIDEGTAACTSVCERFGECSPDDNFDVEGCKTDCEEEAQTDNSFASDACECKICVDKDFGANGDPDTCPSDFTLCTSECTVIKART